jgi:hypothetical protein
LPKPNRAKALGLRAANRAKALSGCAATWGQRTLGLRAANRAKALGLRGHLGVGHHGCIQLVAPSSLAGLIIASMC